MGVIFFNNPWKKQEQQGVFARFLKGAGLIGDN